MNRAVSGICSIILCLFLAPSLGAQQHGQAGTLQAQKPFGGHAMGSSPCAWWMPTNDDGQNSLDIQGRLNELRSDGFQCEVFVIESSNPVNSYDNFQKILEATKDTDIATWVVIVPPAEKGADTLPFRTDYVAWTRAFAKLSLKYKNFRGNHGAVEIFKLFP